MSQPLATAFLALADDHEPVDQRTVPRVFAAVAASLALAVGAPLGLLVVDPSDQAVATLAGSKVTLAADDD